LLTKTPVLIDKYRIIWPQQTVNGLRGIFVNQALSSLPAGPLEITRIHFSIEKLLLCFERYFSKYKNLVFRLFILMQK